MEEYKFEKNQAQNLFTVFIQKEADILLLIQIPLGFY